MHYKCGTFCVSLHCCYAWTLPAAWNLWPCWLVNLCGRQANQWKWLWIMMVRNMTLSRGAFIYFTFAVPATGALDEIAALRKACFNKWNGPYASVLADATVSGNGFRMRSNRGQSVSHRFLLLFPTNQTLSMFHCFKVITGVIGVALCVVCGVRGFVSRIRRGPKVSERKHWLAIAFRIVYVVGN